MSKLLQIILLLVLVLAMAALVCLFGLILMWFETSTKITRRRKILAMRKKITCFFIGHKLLPTEQGFFYCDRCDAHEYYDYDTFYRTIPTLFIIVKNKFRRCSDCGKIDLIFGKSVSNHDDCLPF